MSWQILLLVSIIFLSLNGLFHRSLLKDDKSDPIAQAIIFLGIGGVIAIFIALLRGKLDFSFPPSLILNFAIIGIFMSAAYVLKYRGFQLINASEVAIFASTSKLWNVVGAYFFLHETITFSNILGAIIILVGIAITMYVDKKFQINKGILFVLMGAVLFGLTDINGFYILQSIDASNYQIYSTLIPVAALLIIKPSSVKKLGYYFRPDRGIKVSLLSLFDTLGMLALFFAYQFGGKAAIIGPLSATKVIITVILAAVLLKERKHITNKLIGAAVTVFGVILLL